MRKTLLGFALAGGLVVPAIFTLLGWAVRRFASDPDGAVALLLGVQLPLWPMSRLILADPAGKHWLYLPLAAVLSNALVYAGIGLLAAWGRVQRAGLVVAIGVTVAILVALRTGFGTSWAGLVVAVVLSLLGLVLHHRAASGR